jgi:signal transduction histidine kinase
LAGEQERSLRSLIHQQETAADVVLGDVDVAGALQRLTHDHPVRVQLAAPGRTVLMDAARADELVAAVKACLDNVAAHVGADAQAWVLLDADEATVTVSVRDEGPGIAAGRLEEADAQGRLGVSSSIRGRVAELGGDARLDTGPWGTEWELEVPRRVGEE